MKGQELYDLIHSLTPSRKRNLKLFGSLYQKKGAWAELFDRINALPKYDADHIREGKFQSSKNYSVAKRKIIDLLVGSIAHFEYQNQVSTIEVARDLELRDYVIKNIKSALKDAQKREAIPELQQLYAIARSLRADPAYRFQLPTITLSEEKLLEEINRIHRLEQFLEETRLGIPQSTSERKFAATRIEAGLQKEIPLTRRANYLLQKAYVGCASLRNYDQKAILKYETFIEEMEAGKFDLAVGERMREYFGLVLTCLSAGEVELAQKHVMRMGMARGNTPWEQRIHDGFLVLTSIHVSEESMDRAFLELGLERLKTQRTHLTDTQVVIQYLVASKVYFVNGEFRKTLRMLRQVERFPLSHWSNFSWFMKTLELVSIVELEEWDRFDQVAEQARRLTSRNSYAGEIVSFARAIARPSTKANIVSAALKAIQKIDDALLSSEVTREQVSLFDFRIWLQAKVSGSSMIAEFNRRRQADIIKVSSQS